MTFLLCGIKSIKNVIMTTKYFEIRESKYENFLYFKGEKSNKSNILFLALYPFSKPALYPILKMISRQLGYEGWLINFVYPSNLDIVDNFFNKPQKHYADRSAIFLSGVLDNPDYPIDTVVCCWGEQINDVVTRFFLEHSLYKTLDVLLRAVPSIQIKVFDYIKDSSIPIGVDAISLNSPLILKDYDAKTERKKIRIKYNLPPDISYRM